MDKADTQQCLLLPPTPPPQRCSCGCSVLGSAPAGLGRSPLTNQHTNILLPAPVRALNNVVAATYCHYHYHYNYHYYYPYYPYYYHYYYYDYDYD